VKETRGAKKNKGSHTPHETSGKEKATQHFGEARDSVFQGPLRTITIYTRYLRPKKNKTGLGKLEIKKKKKKKNRDKTRPGKPTTLLRGTERLKRLSKNRAAGEDLKRRERGSSGKSSVWESTDRLS